MKILVTGNPRSGTLSFKNMLCNAGYKVGHEKLGPDGTVSCFFFTKARYYPREKLTANRHMLDVFDAKDFDIIIHLVRNPLKCIPSMHKIVGVGHREWLHYIDVVDKDIKPKLLWSAHAWYETNNRIEKLTRRIIRIEEVNKLWPKELYKPKKILHQHRSSGTRKSRPMTMKSLLALPDGIGDKIVKQAKRYGYDL